MEVKLEAQGRDEVWLSFTLLYVSHRERRAQKNLCRFLFDIHTVFPLQEHWKCVFVRKCHLSKAHNVSGKHKPYTKVRRPLVTWQILPLLFEGLGLCFRLERSQREGFEEGQMNYEEAEMSSDVQRKGFSWGPRRNLSISALPASPS